jgi:glucose-1-phosphate cytidylyltransferase
MKAIILAGGLGTRLSEETASLPKPMVKIGSMPILWHIMKIYSSYGINDFIICAGYKGYVIKEYFSNYYLHTSDITFDIKENKIDIHHSRSEPWKITIVDTGEHSMTGGRLARVKDFIKNDKEFCFTYGDGLSNINIKELIMFHRSHQKLATVSATFPPGRFGALEIENEKVNKFIEKPMGDGQMINGGFFVLSPKVIELIEDDSTIWEKSPLETLAKNEQLMAYKHKDFWQPMDTLRDKNYLEDLWNSGKAPWKIWDN